MRTYIQAAEHSCFKIGQNLMQHTIIVITMIADLDMLVLQYIKLGNRSEISKIRSAIFQYLHQWFSLFWYFEIITELSFNSDCLHSYHCYTFPYSSACKHKTLYFSPILPYVLPPHYPTSSHFFVASHLHSAFSLVLLMRQENHFLYQHASHLKKTLFGDTCWNTPR